MTPALSPEEWRHVAQLFESAIDLPADQRQAFLDRSCEPDSRIREEVERMLSADQEASTFLEKDPLSEWDRPAFTPESGMSVGVYRLVRELGSGGMGTVWLAERDDNTFAQKVAIKFSRLGFISAESAPRLRAERRILAQLQHPHIARMLDAGAVGPGVPYLVMEYVDGRPLLKAAVAQRLTLAERLRLFIDVCHAVQFAHQRLIVHRDLKPENIYVDTDGRVRLLDFGVAKLLQSDADLGELAPTTAAFCTPAYASPEQLRGELVTTASDVYSLGCILFELVTGERVPGQPSLEIPVPSRHCHNADRDMDAIVRFALQPEADQRYPSARALAEDVERYLSGLPVTARPAKAGYRLTKFVRRHRAAAVLLWVALALAVYQFAQARHAQRIVESHQDDLHRLALNLLFDYHDKVARLPGSTVLRAQIAADSLAYLQKLAQTAQTDERRSSLAQDISVAWVRLGDVQGRPWSANQGDTAAALRSYRQAEEWAHRAGSPALALANAWQRQGQVETRLHDWPNAQRHLRDAGEKLRDAKTDEELMLRSSSINALGDATVRSGDLAGVRYHEEALALAEAMNDRVKATDQWVRLHAVIEQRLGLYLGAHGSAPEGVRRHQLASSDFDGLLRRQPDDPGALRDYADELVMKAEAQARAGDPAGAVADCDRGIALFERLQLQDPSNVEARRDLGYAWFARAAAAAGRCDVTATTKALAIFESLLQSAGANQEDAESATQLRARAKVCR